jgi:hypothetical protein
MCRLLEEIYWWEIEKKSAVSYIYTKRKNVDATKLDLTEIDHDPKTENENEKK